MKPKEENKVGDGKARTLPYLSTYPFGKDRLFRRLSKRLHKKIL